MTKYLLQAIKGEKSPYWDLVWFDDETKEISEETIWEKEK